VCQPAGHYLCTQIVLHTIERGPATSSIVPAESRKSMAGDGITLIRPTSWLLQDGGGQRPEANMLDHKSFSLVQNAQALLAPGCDQAQVCAGQETCDAVLHLSAELQ
jgi:hypothetical protein